MNSIQLDPFTVQFECQMTKECRFFPFLIPNIWSSNQTAISVHSSDWSGNLTYSVDAVLSKGRGFFPKIFLYLVTTLSWLN